MTSEKIKPVAAFYEERFKEEGILSKRIPTNKYFSFQTEMLARAQCLLSDSVMKLADDSEKKVGLETFDFLAYSSLGSWLVHY